MTNAFQVSFRKLCCFNWNQSKLYINKKLVPEETRKEGRKKGINQSIDRSIDQSINQSISQSINQSINQSIVINLGYPVMDWYLI